MAHILKSCPVCGKIHGYSKCCKAGKKYEEVRNKEIQRFRGSKAWKLKREIIKERDLYMCVMCRYENDELTKDSVTIDELSVHHIVPLNEDFELRLEDNNLITLCRYHHELAEKGIIPRGRLKELLKVPPIGNICD